jgi:ribosomal protein S18 acetylase RimI-like enzyme
MRSQELLKVEPELALALEETEAVYWSKYYYSDEQLPCFATIVAGAFVGSLPQVDILAMNRVIGLGMMKMVEARDIQSIINFYSKAGARRFFVQLSPYALQDDLPEMLTEAGFRLHNHWAKLMRKLEVPLPVIDSGLRIERLSGQQEKGKVYGRILFDSFDWEDVRLQRWLGKTVDQIGYRHYLAYQGDTPIAAAALHLMGKYASMAFAGTQSAYRGMGAQRALLEQRLVEAQQAGCQYIFSETAVSTVENPVQSYKNMIRLGFEEVYQRQNWIFEL